MDRGEILFHMSGAYYSSVPQKGVKNNAGQRGEFDGRKHWGSVEEGRPSLVLREEGAMVAMQAIILSTLKAVIGICSGYIPSQDLKERFKGLLESVSRPAPWQTVKHPTKEFISLEPLRKP